MTKLGTTLAYDYDSRATLHLATARSLLAWLPPIPPTGVGLDFGAATAPMAWQLRTLCPELTWLAVEPDLFLLLEAQSRGRLAQDFQAVCSSLERMPLPDRSVDVIFSAFALHRCQGVETIVAELTRVMKPQGQLLVAMPVAGSLPELQQTNLQLTQLYSSSQWIEHFSRYGWALEQDAEQQITEYMPSLTGVLNYLAEQKMLHVQGHKISDADLQQLEERYLHNKTTVNYPVTWRIALQRYQRTSEMV